MPGGLAAAVPAVDTPEPGMWLQGGAPNNPATEDSQIRSPPRTVVPRP